MIARDEDGTFSAYAWPGGYPVFHMTSTDDVLCPNCANEHGHVGKPTDEFRIVASDVNYEDEHLNCDGCSERIESAYGEDEDEDE